MYNLCVQLYVLLTIAEKFNNMSEIHFCEYQLKASLRSAFERIPWQLTVINLGYEFVITGSMEKPSLHVVFVT